MRRYLLGELGEAEEENFELRLLTDPAFGEEFDTVVDEIIDDYVHDEFQGDQRQRVEQYFLTTTERQHKLEFASELMRRAEAVRRPVESITVPPVVEIKPGLLEKIRAFFANQSFARLATTAAALLLVASIGFYALRPGSYTSLDLAMSTTDRAESTAPARVKLPGGGLNISLAIPESAKGAPDYRVKLIGAGVEQDLAIAERNEQTIKVVVPAVSLSRGSYVIQLSKKKADGGVERVRGSYFFDVE